jgi:signal transduction histidine kinase
MTVLNFLTLFTAIANLTLGIIVFSQDNRKPLYRSFFIFSVIDAIWAYTNFHFHLWPSFFIFQSQYSFGGAVLIVALVWILYLTEDRLSRVKLFAIYLLSLLIFSLPYIDGIIIKGLIPAKNNQFDFITGPGFYYYGSFLILYLIYLLYKLSSGFRHASGIKRMQLRYVLFGISIFSFITILFGVILPLFNINPVVAYDAQSSIIWVALTAYAIIAHQLFDIRVIIKKTLEYSGLLAFTIGVYSLIVFLFSHIFGNNNFLSTFIAASLIAFGFDPIRKYLTNVTDKYLFKGEYDAQSVLTQLSQKLSDSVDITQANQSLVTLIKSQMRLTHAAVVTFATEEDKTVAVKNITQDGYANPVDLQQILPEGAVIQQFVHQPRVILTELTRQQCDTNTLDPTTKQICELLLVDLDKVGAAIALPILVNKRAIGMFLVGEKLSGDVFTKEEVEFLTIVSNQTANAIEKARFWEEDQMKSEFVSIASHELLTPTAAMKGYLSMILDDNMGQVDDTARRYLTKVAQSSDRLAQLVEELLNVSRIESGRVKINNRPFSLIDSVQKAVEELQLKAKEKTLDLAFISPTTPLPPVFADPDHVYRVLINLIGNSIKYTARGWVRCFVTQYDQKQLLFTITDSGLGIPEENLPHLFEKFYRADRKDIAGIQGTGLGLYISKKIVELMGGQMWVESTVGKGTTFYFTVPIQQPGDHATTIEPQPVQQSTSQLTRR